MQSDAKDYEAVTSAGLMSMDIGVRVELQEKSRG